MTATSTVGNVTVVQGDVFTSDLPLGQARLVYADPPYMAEDYFGYGGAPEWPQLIDRMHELGADDAVYLLHIGVAGLAELLPIVEERAPKRRRRHSGGRVRVLAWVKPWSAWRPNTIFQHSWEPILLWYGRKFSAPQRAGVNGSTDDWIAVPPQRSRYGHPTEKSDQLLRWLFDNTLHRSQGRLAIDLFAGTGSAALMATEYGCDAIAVEHGAAFADIIRGRVLERQTSPRLTHLENIGEQLGLEGVAGGSPGAAGHPPSGRRRDHLERGRRAGKAGKIAAALLREGPAT